MKVIFLDVDGPLAFNSELDTAFNIGDIRMPYPWKQEACDALSEIIKQTDAKIVISSDWKYHYSLEELGKIFEHYGIPNVIIGKTSLGSYRMSANLEVNRGYQICLYVEQNRDEIKKWVALDDLDISWFLEREGETKPYIKKENYIYIDGDTWAYNQQPLAKNVDNIVNFLNN